ncbi:uncharacterized protein TNCV_196861 [Trichonephila clavipes]|uniref:Uncharacterized protein n=1 Tax=Trichonephila clavipes TaxID=2585209 RepID=A0A8X6WK94_TRICX|nr:uncharacterized protein TNCV_196861 [Trichonephila clavipes]
MIWESRVRRCRVTIESPDATEHPSYREVDALEICHGSNTLAGVGMGSNPGEGMDVCKCRMPSQQGSTLNSRRAASPLVRLVEGKERWEAPDFPLGCSPSKLGRNQAKNRIVTCMVLVATTNERRNKLPIYCNEFRVP